LFADDLKTYMRIINNSIINKLQLAFDALSDWEKTWQLSISFDKSNIYQKTWQNYRVPACPHGLK